MTALTGIGSSVFHPEASRLTSLASGGHRGLAQSLFQVGGNLGYALGPLLVAVLVAPYGRAHFAWFAVFALVAVAIMVPISRWYKRSFLDAPATDEAKTVRAGMPLSLRRTVWAIAVLLVLIFSKYMYMAALTNYYTFYLSTSSALRSASRRSCCSSFWPQRLSERCSAARPATGSAAST